MSFQLVPVVPLIALSLAVGCGAKSQDDESASTSGNAGSGSSSSAQGGSTGGGGSKSGSGSGSGSGGASSSSTGSGGSGVSSSGGANHGGTSAAGSGGANSGGTSAAGSGGAAECTAQVFEGFDKSCTTVDDCLLVDHATNCCGDQLRMAINANEAEAFGAVETHCSSLLPLCECPTHGVSAEDGNLVPYGSGNLIVARCTQGACSSHYDALTFQCANVVCTTDEICTIVLGGAPGSEPSGSCSPDSGCTDCDCAGANAACPCSISAGNITLTCAAP